MIKSNSKIFFWIFFVIILGFCGYFWGPLSPSSECDVIVPIDFIAVPKGLIQVGSKVKNIEVRLSGPKSEVDRLLEQNLKYSLRF